MKHCLCNYFNDYSIDYNLDPLQLSPFPEIYTIEKRHNSPLKDLYTNTNHSICQVCTILITVTLFLKRIVGIINKNEQNRAEKACFSYRDVIQWRVFSYQILSDRGSKHHKPFYRMTQCVAAAEQDDVVIGRIRAAEVTAGDVSHGSLLVDGLIRCNVRHVA